MYPKLVNALRFVPGLQDVVRNFRKKAHQKGLERTQDRVMGADGYEILVVFGMRRSGNHVAINWILEQVDGPAVFYNNINPDKHPFTAGRTEFREKSGPSPRLVISYEDVSQDRLLSPELLAFLKDRVAEDGAYVRFAVIQRDPYNLFASRLRKWPERFGDDAQIKAQVELYKGLAALAANPRPIWNDAPLIPVLYNELVSNGAAREGLSSALGINSGDRGLNEVPVYGHGSSFDGTTLTGETVRDHVFERWRSLESDPVFQRIMSDADLQKIGQDLFGMAPPSLAAP